MKHNPFEGHPYRGGLSEEEKQEMLKQELIERFKHILEVLNVPQGINTLSGKDWTLGDMIWSRLRYTPTTAAGMVSVFDFEDLGRDLKISTEQTKQFIKQFKKDELLEFKEKWVPD